LIDNRLYKHPILPVGDRPLFTFYFRDQELKAREGETIASALFANGIRIFSYHHKDGAPQGIFCANGQCAQCLVLADGFPVKSCMELIKPGMRIEPVVGLPELPSVDSAAPLDLKPVEEIEVSVLIIGGGPAGCQQPLNSAGAQWTAFWLMINTAWGKTGTSNPSFLRFGGSSLCRYPGN